jgi:hypothetical protein
VKFLVAASLQRWPLRGSASELYVIEDRCTDLRLPLHASVETTTADIPMSLYAQDEPTEVANDCPLSA